MTKNCADTVEPFLSESSIEINSHEAFEMLLPYFDPIIKYYIKIYFSWGGDKEDLYQQGLIGLYKATLAYDQRKNGSFKNLAIRCIKLNILNLVRADNAKKRLINYHCRSLEQSINEDFSLMDVLPANVQEPLNQIIEKESICELREKIGFILSDLERNVLFEFLENKTYEQIARDLSLSTKTVDNALQRIKKKIKERVI